MIKKLRESSLFSIISCLIIVISLASILTPDNAFSENENRPLDGPPVITFSSLLDGSYSHSYEKYVNDQFWMRDTWIETKSVTEFAQLKTENNGVVYGKKGYMFQKFSNFDSDVLIRNLDAIDYFAYNSVSDVSFIVVPSAYYPLIDYLPAGVPVVDQGFYITEINSYLSPYATPVNVKDTLVVNADEYIYYRTDHHWTNYGAWLAYSQFASSAGFEAVDYNRLPAVQVEGFLGTSYSKSKAFNAVPDTLEYFDFPGRVTVVRSSGDVRYDSLYDYEQLEKRDKYAGLLHGNNAMAIIEGKQSPKNLDCIVVICDSFGFSFIPYLTQNYNKIIMIDPRYYTGSFAEFRETMYDDILIIFGFESYCTIKDIMKLALD